MCNCSYPYNSSCSCNNCCGTYSTSSTVITLPPLSGGGTATSPLGITAGTVTGQVLQWNGTAWVAAAVTGVSPQTLSLVTRSLSISGGNTVTLPTDIQVLSFTAPNLTLSQSGGSVNLASFVSSDSPNLLSVGVDSKLKATLNTTFPITGSGTSLSPLSLSHSGVTTGQYLSWNGTTWVGTSPIVLSVNGQTGNVNISLNDITDVVTSSTLATQLLRFDGSNWVNWTPNYTTLPSASTVGSMLYWNGSSYAPVTPRRDIQHISSGITVTLPYTPLAGTIVDFYLNGSYKEEGIDYTRAGAVITMAYSFAVNDIQISRFYS